MLFIAIMEIGWIIEPKANPRSLVFTIGFSAGVVDQLLR